MSLSAIGRGGNISPKASQGEGASLDEQVKRLERQLEQVKNNDKLDKTERAKRIKNLQSQIDRLEEKIAAEK